MITVGEETHICRHRGRDIPYTLMPHKTLEGWWYWEALGNGGKEPSKESASQTARRWIKDRQ